MELFDILLQLHTMLVKLQTAHSLEVLNALVERISDKLVPVDAGCFPFSFCFDRVTTLNFILMISNYHFIQLSLRKRQQPLPCLKAFLRLLSESLNSP